MMKTWETIWDIISDYKYGVFNSHWWKDFYYEQISSRLWPRNRWLTKQIPRTWVDKDTIMEITILACLKHYVEPEGEDAFGVLDISNPPEQAEFLREVKRQYELTTQTLVALQEQLKKEWDAVPLRGWKDINTSTAKGDYERLYGKIDRLEKEIYDLQTEIMTWVIKHRDELWT